MVFFELSIRRKQGRGRQKRTPKTAIPRGKLRIAQGRTKKKILRNEQRSAEPTSTVENTSEARKKWRDCRRGGRGVGEKRQCQKGLQPPLKRAVHGKQQRQDATLEKKKRVEQKRKPTPLQQTRGRMQFKKKEKKSKANYRCHIQEAPFGGKRLQKNGEGAPRKGKKLAAGKKGLHSFMQDEHGWRVGRNNASAFWGLGRTGDGEGKKSKGQERDGYLVWGGGEKGPDFKARQSRKKKGGMGPGVVGKIAPSEGGGGEIRE